MASDFLKVSFNKKKGHLDVSGSLRGDLDSVVKNIRKNDRVAGNDPENVSYYNTVLMLTGKKGEFERYVKEHIPNDTNLFEEQRNAAKYLGDLLNFNSKWLTPEGGIIDLNTALTVFAPYTATYNSEDDYKLAVVNQHTQLVQYFDYANSIKETAKKSKSKVTPTFEELRSSLGPFRHLETGKLVLKAMVQHNVKSEKTKTKRSGDQSFDKYFFPADSGEAVRVQVSKTKNGSVVLQAKSVLLSSIQGSTRSKAIAPFSFFSQLYFNTDDVVEYFLQTLAANPDKVANTLRNPEFVSRQGWGEYSVLPTDEAITVQLKVAKFIELLKSEYMRFRQTRAQYHQPVMPLANSSQFRY